MCIVVCCVSYVCIVSLLYVVEKRRWSWKETAELRGHYLSNATCLIRPRLVSPLSKRTCVRQVVLDKWFPLSGARKKTSNNYNNHSNNNETNTNNNNNNNSKNNNNNNNELRGRLVAGTAADILASAAPWSPITSGYSLILYHIIWYDIILYHIILCYIISIIVNYISLAPIAWRWRNVSDPTHLIIVNYI